MKKINKKIFLGLFIFLSIFLTNIISLSTNSKIYVEAASSNTVLATETFEFDTYKYKVDKKQAVFFAVHYIKSNFSMNSLDFPEMSYSEVPYNEELANEVSTVVEFEYANQSFYIYGEGVKAHHREYKKGFLSIFPDVDFSPKINIKKSDDGFIYAGYTLHGYKSIPTGTLATRSTESDLTKNYIYDWDLWNGKQKTNELDPETNAKILKNRTILVNLYFYKPTDITVETPDINLGTVTKEADLNDYTNGEKSIVYKNCPLNTKINVKEHNKELNQQKYNLSYSYNKIIDNKEITYNYSTDFYALARDQVSFNHYTDELIYNDIYHNFKIPLENGFNDLTFNVSVDINDYRHLYFIAEFYDPTTYMTYRSKEYQLDDTKELSITIEDIPSHSTGNVSIFYYYKDTVGKTNNYNLFKLSNTKLNNFDSSTNEYELINVIEDLFVDHDMVIEESLVYFYQLYTIEYQSNIEGILNLPEKEYVLYNSSYSVSTIVPIVSSSEYSFYGYASSDNEILDEEIIVNSNIVLYPIYRKSIEAYFSYLDLSIVTVNGYEYSKDLINKFKTEWDTTNLVNDSTTSYSHLYWLKNITNNPYEIDKLSSFNDIEVGKIYYSIGVKPYKVNYVINTKPNITGYSYNTKTGGYAKYLISNGTKTISYADLSIDSLDTPTAANGTFLGFKIDSLGDTLYKPGELINLPNNLEDITLLASWEEVKYELKIIHYNDETTSNTEIIKGSYNETILINSPSIPGCKFNSYKLINTDSTGKLVKRSGSYYYTFGTTNDVIEGVYDKLQRQVNVKLIKNLSNNITFTLEVYNNEKLVNTFNVSTSSSNLYSINAYYNDNIKYVLKNTNNNYNISFTNPSNTLTFDLEHNHIVNENEINLIELNVTQLYLIQFMGNGNTCTNNVENIYKMHNTDLLLPVNPYMKDEMLNGGWALSKNSTDNVTIYTNNNNAIFYSIFPIMVKFNTGVEEINTYYDYNESYTPINNPTREGYIFVGWNTFKDTNPIWTSGEEIATYDITWYAVWSKYDNAYRQEIDCEMDIYMGLYEYPVKLYSYKDVLYDNVLYYYSYDLSINAVQSFDDAIETDEFTLIPVEFYSEINGLRIAGYTQDQNSLEPTWTSGEKYLTENEIWYAVEYYTKDIEYEEVPLVHTFHTGLDTFFTVSTTMKKATNMTVMLRNYMHQKEEETTEFEIEIKPTYTSLEYQTVESSIWGTVDVDFRFLGWADEPDSLMSSWSNGRSIVPTEEMEYYALYHETKTPYVEVTEFDIVYHISEDEEKNVKASRVTNRYAENVCNFDNTVRTVRRFGSVISQTGTNISLIDISDIDSDFIGWSKLENNFDNILEPGYNEEQRSETHYYAVYQRSKNEKLDQRIENYYFIINDTDFKLIKNNVYTEYEDVTRYYNYNNTKTSSIISKGEQVWSVADDIIVPLIDSSIVGWSSNPNDPNIEYQVTIDNPDSFYYYAIYENKKEIQINYKFFEEFTNSNEILELITYTNYNGSKILNNEFTITLPVAYESETHIHEYWYLTNNNEEIIYEPNSEYSFNYLDTNEITFYGKVVEKEKYLVSYLDNEAFVCLENDTITLKDAVVKENYTFSHYDINGTMYYENDKIIVTSDLTIIPVYLENPKYSVLFTNTNETVVVYENDTITLPLPSEIENYEFRHWLVNEEEYSPNDIITVKTNLTITPIYEEIKYYTVTFSNSVEEYTVRENEEVNVLSAETIEGYEFVGYQVNDEVYEELSSVIVNEDTHIKLLYNNVSIENISSTGSNSNLLPIILPIIIAVVIISLVVVFIIIKKKEKINKKW